MSADFVAALIDGFESTLDEVLDRLEESALRREVEMLQQHLAEVKERCLSAPRTECDARSVVIPTKAMR